MSKDVKEHEEVSQTSSRIERVVDTSEVFENDEVFLKLPKRVVQPLDVEVDVTATSELSSHSSEDIEDE